MSKKVQKTKKFQKFQIKKKKSFFSYISDGFKFYFYNPRIILPLLIWLIISFVIGCIGFLIFYFKNKSILSEISKLSSQGIPLTLFNLPNITSLIVSALIIFSIIGFIILIIYFLFLSSTLVFAKNIVNGVKKEKDILKKSFRNCNYWLKLIGVKFIQFVIVGFFGLIYFLLLILIPSLLKSKILALSILLPLLIIFYFLFLFVVPAPYILVYSNSKIFQAFKISITGVKQAYWKFLLIILFFDIISSFLILIPYISIFINYLFIIQLKALTITLFIKENFRNFKKF